MKIFVAAMTFVLAAAPAVAQTAPAQHQDHRQHQAAQHAQHAQHQAGHATQHSQHQPGQHDGHAMRDGCCADRNNNDRMDCCENMPQGHECCAHDEQPASGQAQPSGHQNH
jgi:hypothetical protein